MTRLNGSVKQTRLPSLGRLAQDRSELRKVEQVWASTIEPELSEKENGYACRFRWVVPLTGFFAALPLIAFIYYWLEHSPALSYQTTPFMAFGLVVSMALSAFIGT